MLRIHCERILTALRFPIVVGTVAAVRLGARSATRKEDAMPGLSGRMSTVVKAKISKLLDRAEDPAETLEYSYQKQIEQLQNVKKGIADVVTSKKRLQLQSERLQQNVVKLDTQARQALAAGQEDLARTALERKNVAQTELQGLDGQITELQKQQEQLTQSEQNLRTKIEQFRSKKEIIKAQYSAAEAQVRISEAATGVGEEMADVGLAMQRALDKTENMKARASAVQELEAAGTFEDLTQLGSGEDDIDRQLKALSSTSEVDTELAKMKAELGGGPAPTGELGGGPAPTGELGAGAGSADEPHGELESESSGASEPAEEQAT
jgi:phage shock protein A